MAIFALSRQPVRNQPLPFATDIYMFWSGFAIHITYIHNSIFQNILCFQNQLIGGYSFCMFLLLQGVLSSCSTCCLSVIIRIRSLLVWTANVEIGSQRSFRPWIFPFVLKAQGLHGDLSQPWPFSILQPGPPGILLRLRMGGATAAGLLRSHWSTIIRATLPTCKWPYNFYVLSV